MDNIFASIGKRALKKIITTQKLSLQKHLTLKKKGDKMCTCPYTGLSNQHSLNIQVRIHPVKISKTC